MAKEKPRCVLCGQETEFFRRASLPLYNTNQIVCTGCKQHYDGASLEERNRMKEQMLSSPYLWDGERIQKLMKWRQEEEERSAVKEHTNVLKAARREQATVCCGEKMHLQGHARLQMHEHGINTEQISMAVYECEMCGQLKFFKYLPSQ